MESVIAKQDVLVIRPGEEPFQVSIQIGTPHEVGDQPEEWACPVAMQPLYKRLHPAHGGSSLQALCLAASLVLDLLLGVREKGGRVTLTSGEDFPLESYSFGPAIRKKSSRDGVPAPRSMSLMCSDVTSIPMCTLERLIAGLIGLK